MTLRGSGDRRRLGVGAALWMLTAVYFAVQPWVAAAWSPPYEWLNNTISDLGVTSCGEKRTAGTSAPTCSPRHLTMNIVFVFTGLCTVGGTLLLRNAWPPNRWTKAGSVAFVLSGIGGVLVGLAPSNLNGPVHGAGAALQLAAAVGPLLFGLGLPATTRRWVSIAAGAIGLVGCALFFSGVYLVEGPGLTERVGFDPSTLWTAAAGAAFLRCVEKAPVLMQR